MRTLSALILLVAGPLTGKLAACAACFGKTDAPLAQGMNAGILVMLAFVVGAWIAFGSFFVFIARRSRETESASSADASESANPPLPSSNSFRNQ